MTQCCSRLKNKDKYSSSSSSIIFIAATRHMISSNHKACMPICAMLDTSKNRALQAYRVATTLPMHDTVRLQSNSARSAGQSRHNTPQLGVQSAAAACLNCLFHQPLLCVAIHRRAAVQRLVPVLLDITRPPPSALGTQYYFPLTCQALKRVSEPT